MYRIPSWDKKKGPLGLAQRHEINGLDIAFYNPVYPEEYQVWQKGDLVRDDKHGCRCGYVSMRT